ncbi:MAG: hypothetical protein KGI51_03630 [Rhodospirillales bacterium]|nr:hypothetical protein [Rhodospirillales bacterium]
MEERRAGGMRRAPMRSALEPAVAFLLALAFYRALYGQVLYHDTARFAAQIRGGRFVWDIGHIFLQPATLLWHRYLGFGEGAIASQKHINSVATALAIAIFAALLRRLGIPPWRRVLATALLAASASVITLAPTGHMKLVAFPFVTASLFLGIVWERARAERRRASAWLWIGSAGLLALA